MNPKYVPGFLPSILHVLFNFFLHNKIVINEIALPSIFHKEGHWCLKNLFLKQSQAAQNE